MADPFAAEGEFFTYADVWQAAGRGDFLTVRRIHAEDGIAVFRIIKDDLRNGAADHFFLIAAD